MTPAAAPLVCYLLDDERSALAVLKKYVADTPGLVLGGASTDVGQAATDLLAQPGTALVFLDIEMPKLTGPQFADLYCRNRGVIFTTAYSQYALEGYEHGIIDYLLKPIAYDRFLKAVAKAQRQLRPLAAEPLAAEPLETIATSPGTEEDALWVKTEHKGKLLKVSLADILYIESQKNYVAIGTRNRERIITYIGLSELETRLPITRFVRVHRSFIVALEAITALEGNELLLQDTSRIPTAGTYKEDLLRWITPQLVQSKNK